jgi:hypothetical protein
MVLLLMPALLLSAVDDVTPPQTPPETAPPATTVDAPAVTEPPTTTPPAPERFKLISLDLKGANVTPQDLSLLSGLLAVELGAYEALEVVSGAEVRQLVELEGEKAMLGCEASASCLAEIAGALGARLVAFGELGRLGKRYVLNLSLHDSKTNRSVGRASLQGEDIEGLADGMTEASITLVEPFLQSENASTKRTGNSRIKAPRVPRDEPAAVNWRRSGGGIAAVVGGVGFAGAYAASTLLPPLLNSKAEITETLLIPVGGPFIVLSSVERGGDGSQDNFDPTLLLLGFGSAQALFGLSAVVGSLAWSTAVINEEPATTGAAQAWRWGLLGGGAAAVGGAVAIDTLVASSNDRNLDAVDVTGAALYVVGGTAMVLSLAMNPFIASQPEGAE